jgi:hypothetical protein
MIPLVLLNRGTETQTLVVQMIEGFQNSEVRFPPFSECHETKTMNRRTKSNGQK